MSRVEIEIPDNAPAGQHGVYVLFDIAGEPLYIGRTSSLFRRMTQHRSQSAWWPRVRSLEWTPCVGAVAARVVERDMIAAFHPDANINDAIPVRTGRCGDLPDETVRVLRRLYNASEGRGTESDDRLNAYIKALRTVGWPLASVGKALGFTREGIRLREARAVEVAGLPPVPAVPVKVKPQKPPKPELPAATVERLRDLHRQCRHLNGSAPADDPMRQASVELTELLASLVIDGWSVATLARVLKVTHFAVASRLARHGYTTPAPSQASHPYKGEPGYVSQARAVCKWGHPLEGDNLYLLGGGERTRRVCRTCHRRRHQEYRARLASSAVAS